MQIIYQDMVTKRQTGEDRTWAVDLTEEEYEREFTRRFPLADSMPDKASYINTSESPKFMDSIDPINPDTYIEAPANKTEEPVQTEKIHTTKKGNIIVELDDGNFKCIGCDKVAGAKIAIISHQRKCEGYLQMRSNG